MENKIWIIDNVPERCLIIMLTSSDMGAWELGKRPNLTALLMIEYSRCLSEL